MNWFVSFILFTLIIFLLSVVRGHPPDKIFSKFRENLVDQLYSWLLLTGAVHNGQMCAKICRLNGVCTLFQFRDEHCKLFINETVPGMGIISLTNMTEVWILDTGNATVPLKGTNVRKWNYHISSTSVLASPFVK